MISSHLTTPVLAGNSVSTSGIRPIWTMLIAGLLAIIAHPVFACDSCVPQGQSEIQGSYSVVQAGTSGEDIVGNMMKNFTSIFGMSNSTVSPPAGVPGASITCTTLASCMQQYFAQLAGTNTNNQLMHSSVNAKGFDYLATQQYTQGMQQQKAKQAVQNAQGPLQYQNNNLCVQATMATGMSALSANVSNNVAGYGAAGRVQGATSHSGAGNSGTTPKAPDNTDEYTPTLSQVSRINNTVSQIQTNFYDSSSDGAAGTYPHWDTDVFTQDQKTDYSNPGDIAAHQQYMNYIVGTPPDNPSKDTSFRKTESGKEAVLASHEKIAFVNTAELAYALDEAERTPLTGGAGSLAAKGVNAMLSAAGDPNVVTGNSISHADLMKAMYKELAENPNTVGNINAMGEAPTLQYIAGLMVYSNYLRYQRYLTAQRDYQVNSALLALEMRNFNFATNP